MRRLTQNTHALQLLAWVLAGCALTGCAIEDHELTLAVSTEEPAPSIAETIRSLLSERGFSIAIDPSTDPTSIVAAIRDRRVDLAIVEESELPVPGVVTLAPLYPSILHVLYIELGAPGNFADLIRGAKVYAGPPGGAAHRLLVQLCVDFGVTLDQFQLLDNPWTVVPDVYFIIGGLLSADSLRQLQGYRLFSFAGADDIDGGSVADGIALRHPHLKPFLLPENVYHALSNEPIVTLSIRSVLIAHEDLNGEFALEIASQLFKHAQEIALIYPLVTRELTVDLKTVELMFPLHIGTRSYLDRDEPGFIERYVEVLTLIFTIVITLLSGAFVLYRHRSQVRKDRVDVYCSQLLEIRRDMAGTNVHAALRLYLQHALDVQHEVMNLLIDERIAADTSLMVFLGLSNQIINELDRRIGYNGERVSDSFHTA